MSSPPHSPVRRASRRRWIVLSCVLVGAVAGFFLVQPRWVFLPTISYGGEWTTIGPDGREIRNAGLTVELFGNQIVDKSGPYEEIDAQHKWWMWSVLGIGALVGANVGLVIGYIVRALTWLWTGSSRE